MAESHDFQDKRACEGFECPNIEPETWYCDDCDCHYCDVCWDKQGQHRPGKVARDGLPHAKAKFNVVEALKTILNPTMSKEELAALHRDDLDTTWYSVDERTYYDINGHKQTDFITKDQGRYGELVMESGQTHNGAPVYPHLVSFVGETNAGKSTLIKMLLTLDAWSGEPLRGQDFRSPVVGSARHDKLPTSGDVHLYADPSTFSTQYPYMFADCEGLNGGSKEPLAKQAQKVAPDDAHKMPFRKILQPIEKPLQWAKEDKYKRSREFAVTEFFPRLLYTFSDAVVFVMRNPKSFESKALHLLLQWAVKSLEKSINQPILPAAVIVFNTTEMNVDESEWDVGEATRSLMDHIKNDINTDPELKDMANLWRGRGIQINTTEELIYRYYSSISLVRIPVKGRYTMLQNQANKLRQEIAQACEEAHVARKRARMLANAEESEMYLRAGFLHFSRNLNAPFNFMDVNIKNNPIPKDSTDHILNFAVTASRGTRPKDAPNVFESLSPFLASCFQLESIKNKRPGSMQDLFAKHYVPICETVLSNFCNSFWPCAYKDAKGRECKNFQSMHQAKGHQNQRGKVFADGAYLPAFPIERFFDVWMRHIKGHLSEAERAFKIRHDAAIAQRSDQSELDIAYKLHQEYAATLFEHNQDRYSSLLTCYFCLMEIPQHPLPCGHAICTSCAKALGTRQGINSIGISSCPLHPNTQFKTPYLIEFKPDFAGVRILSLDGGGVRGIVELEILNRIKSVLGGEIEIHKFFDLIVGTSTGGIIALGLGANHWPVETCRTNFINTCDQAFTPRPFKDVKGAGTAVNLVTGSKFKTAPLQKALCSILGEQRLFGGKQAEGKAYSPKVAVMSTSGTGHEAVVLTNYSRPEDQQLSYKLEFSSQKEPGLPGMKVWQAAAATSAAPGYFKPFIHPSTKHSYMDGALYYNNPAKVAFHERKLIWPDVANRHPDVFVSLGTGQNQADTERSIQEGVKSMQAAEQQREAVKIGNARKGESVGKQAMHRVAGQFIKTLFNRMEKILDSEIAWKEFISSRAGPETPQRDQQRYVRLNPDLGSECPPLDAKHKVSELREMVQDYLNSWEARDTIQQVSRQLVASSFFFEKQSLRQLEDRDDLTCSGKIRCRFEDSPNDLAALGRYLSKLKFSQHRQRDQFRPFFRIAEIVREDAIVVLDKVEISPNVITNMVERGNFELNSTMLTKIPLTNAGTKTDISLCIHEEGGDLVFYPISGFPRKFGDEGVAKDPLKRAESGRSVIEHTISPVDRGEQNNEIPPPIPNKARQATLKSLASSLKTKSTDTLRSRHRTTSRAPSKTESTHSNVRSTEERQEAASKKGSSSSLCRSMAGSAVNGSSSESEVNGSEEDEVEQREVNASSSDNEYAYASESD